MIILEKNKRFFENLWIAGRNSVDNADFKSRMQVASDLEAATAETMEQREASTDERGFKR